MSQEPKFTRDECLKNGGHCYVESGTVTVVGWDRYHQRVCKHCRSEQVGTEQPKIRWEDRK